MRIKLSIKKVSVVGVAGPCFRKQAYCSWSKGTLGKPALRCHPESPRLDRARSVCVSLRVGEELLPPRYVTRQSQRRFTHVLMSRKPPGLEMTKHSTPRAQLQPETDLSLLAQLFFPSCKDERAVLKALSYGVKGAMRYKYNPPNVLSCLPGS